MARVLIVDADLSGARALASSLEAEHFSVEVLGDAFALERLRPDVDLMILDPALPDRPALRMSDFIRPLREQASTSALPVLIVSASDDEADKIAALDAGADDYLVKPYRVREVVARVRALLRRSALRSLERRAIRVGDLVLDRASRRLRFAGVDLHLGPIEFRFVEMLMERPGQTVELSSFKATLLDPSVSDAAVRVSVARLRRVLRTAGPDPILTIRGLGYGLKAEP